MKKRAMKRTIALTVATLMMLGMLAGPAAAENKAYLVPGGIAEFSKTQFFAEATCEKLPWADTTGGLGMPIIAGVKKGYWRVEMDLLNVTTLDTAYLLTCGKLNPVARRLTGAATAEPDDGGIGAACFMSKGYDGRGRIKDSYKDQVIELTNIVWKVTAADAFLAIGHAEWLSKDVDKGRGKLLAEFSIQGPDCFGKAPSSESFEKNEDKATEGATTFTVNGVAAILQEPAADLLPKWKDLPGSEKGRQDNPAFCKREDPGPVGGCSVYGPKKQHEDH